MYGGSDTGSALREEQNKRDARIRAAQAGIEQQFQGFDQDFYKSRQNAYLGFALPQLAEQYQEAQRDLTYSLAGKGLLRSGAAGTLSASLSKELGKKKQLVSDTAINESNTLRMDVQNEQNRLLAQAMNALDPGATVISARKSASQFTEPSTIAPIGKMFQDWTNTYATKVQSDLYNDQAPLTWSVGRGTSKQIG